MAADTGSASPEADALLQPAWVDTADETEDDRGVRRRPRVAEAADLGSLLVPLCAATDALARLDARAVAAVAPVRDGLLARLAYAEAAGFLAYAHAWAHPLDLALRDASLTASTALAATGAGRRTLPQTFGGSTAPPDWAEPPFEALADGDRSVAEALALARALRRLGGATATSAMDIIGALQALGDSVAETARFTAWWDQVAPQPAGRRGGEGTAPSVPALLAAAQAAERWMEAAVAACPAPAQALFLATATLTRTGSTRAVFAPVWAACPALGFGDRAALPTLRSDAAGRLVDRGRPVTWPLAFLHLTAESARMGLRELDRLEAWAEKARGLAATADRRSRLSDAIDLLLRMPALTPKALSESLRIAPQTATALLRDLQARGMIREVTGRGRFRAFAM
jgi:DNA binding protein with HTH domain